MAISEEDANLNDAFWCFWWLNVKFFIQVKFNFDAIDETDLLEETLKSRVESIGGTLEKVSLSGNHITPCIQVINFHIVAACFASKAWCCISIKRPWHSHGRENLLHFTSTYPLSLHTEQCAPVAPKILESWNFETNMYIIKPG